MFYVIYACSEDLGVCIAYGWWCTLVVAPNCMYSERSTGRLSLVFELMDMNIFELIRGRRHFLPEKKVKFYMYQLLKAMDHIHRNGIFHRDIKPENILIADDKLKIADFGSCRGVKSKQPFTEYISTRWYVQATGRGGPEIQSKGNNISGIEHQSVY